MIKPVAWDAAALGMPAWELCEYTEAALQLASERPGHHSVRVAPHADKGLLHRHGFYYCDTLIETACAAPRLRAQQHPQASVTRVIDRDGALAICHGAFSHDRFHRDFQVAPAAAERRYDTWLRQMLDAGTVYGLYWDKTLAGFIAYADNNLVLHAVAPEWRGRGLAKYWWSLVALEVLGAGHASVHSSISASNVSVLNLYASLGFSFKHPLDIYHRLTP